MSPSGKKIVSFLSPCSLYIACITKNNVREVDFANPGLLAVVVSNSLSLILIPASGPGDDNLEGFSLSPMGILGILFFFIFCEDLVTLPRGCFLTESTFQNRHLNTVLSSLAFLGRTRTHWGRETLST